jgi:hypothetical protein
MFIPPSSRPIASPHGKGFAGGQVLAPSVAREFETLQSQLWEQEQKAIELKQKQHDKIRNELVREEQAANNILFRMHTERLNGPGALNPYPTNPALLQPPGGFAPRPSMPHQVPPQSNGPADFPPMVSGPNTLPSLPPSQAFPPPRPDVLPELAHEDLFDLPPDDPDTRHNAVTERCVYLYLKGRLEGFDILRPEFVFDGIDQRYDHADFF